MSAAMRKAAKRLVLRSTVSIKRWLGMPITVSTAPISSWRACSACIMRRLMEPVERGTSFFDAFRIADDILRQAVQGISDIITVPGIINRDFADVKAIMHGQGYAVMGTAVATGTNRAVDAANRAIASPLL